MNSERLTDDMQPTSEELLAPEFEYELLVGHTRTDGSFKSSEQLKTEYVRLTDELIRKATEGVDVTDPQTGEFVKEKPDFIIWLDKSSRPVSWLFRDLWPVLAAGADGNVPKQPESRFVNIDRKQWTQSIDPQGQGVTDVSKVDASIIRSLRSIFLLNAADREQGLTEAIDAAPTQFDGKTLLIIDELRSSGRTLDYATGFFQRAFPDAKIKGEYWMGKTVPVKGKGAVGAIANADKPIWYRDDISQGRGVGDRNIDLSLQSENSTQRLGAWFLSSALHVPDPLSRRMRLELHQLTEDVKAGKVFVEPSINRDQDDYDERALRLNHMTNIEAYKSEKKQYDAA